METPSMQTTQGSGNNRRVIVWCAIALGVAVICLAAVRLFRCESIAVMPVSSPPNPPSGIRYIDRAQALALISPSFLSYEESKSLVLDVARAMHVADLKICRRSLWGHQDENFNGVVFAFGDTWRETVAMKRPAVTVFAIGPRAEPPTDYPYNNLAVILGNGAALERSNAVWKTWCQQHGVVFAEAKDSSVTAIRAAMADAEKTHAALAEKRDARVR